MYTDISLKHSNHHTLCSTARPAYPSSCMMGSLTTLCLDSRGVRLPSHPRTFSQLITAQTAHSTTTGPLLPAASPRTFETAQHSRLTRRHDGRQAFMPLVTIRSKPHQWTHKQVRPNNPPTPLARAPSAPRSVRATGYNSPEPSPTSPHSKLQQRNTTKDVANVVPSDYSLFQFALLAPIELK